MKNITHAEKQLILFSKGHFNVDSNRRFSQYDMLRRIVSSKWKMDYEAVTSTDVYESVVNLYVDLKEMGLIMLTEKEFLKRQLFHWSNDGTTSKIQVMQTLIGEIQGIEVEGKIDLGEVDLTILD